MRKNMSTKTTITAQMTMRSYRKRGSSSLAPMQVMRKSHMVCGVIGLIGADFVRYIVHRQGSVELKKKEPPYSTETKWVGLAKRVLHDAAKLQADDASFFQVDQDFVQDRVLEGSPFEYDDISLAAKIINFILPHWGGHLGNGVVYNAPFLYLSRAIIRSAGFHDFSNSLGPTVACGSLRAMSLNAVGMYETIGKQASQHFDLVGHDGGIISSGEEAAHYLNAGPIFRSIFNMDAINELCKRRGMIFSHR
jgi:hypothetical protein